MLIGYDKKRENVSEKNSLMKKVKIKNEFEGQQEKKIYAQRVKERIDEYYEEKPFKIHAKRKKNNYGEILDAFNKNNENVKRKKPTKAQTMTVKSKQRKNNN